METRADKEPNISLSLGNPGEEGKKLQELEGKGHYKKTHRLN